MCFKRLQPATTSRPRAVVALVGALLVSPSCDDPTPLDVDIQVMQRMLAEPDWTPDEWERRLRVDEAESVSSRHLAHGGNPVNYN